MRVVAIFRSNLFRISEPFITDQAQHLRRYTPIYLGRRRFGEQPDGADSRALQDAGPWRSAPGAVWQMATRDPSAFQHLLANERPALIHAHFGVDGVYALALARRLHIPLITTFHGFDATMSTAAFFASPAWMNYPLFRRRLARQGNLFICVSRFIQKRVLAMGFPEERSPVHYTGVDCHSIQPRDPQEEGRIILHVGRLVEMKGTQYLLRAFAALARRHAETRLVVIGDGPLNRTLRRLAESLGLGDRVDFLGAIGHAQVLTWMRRACMLVLPSVHTGTGRVEGLGMVLLEAAATGVPVVASRVGGIPEGVVDGETGFLVPERDVEALSRCMETLLDDTTLRSRMGWQGRDFVERQFDLRRQTDILEGLYDSVLA